MLKAGRHFLLLLKKVSCLTEFCVYLFKNIFKSHFISSSIFNIFILASYIIRYHGADNKNVKREGTFVIFVTTI